MFQLRIKGFTLLEVMLAVTILTVGLIMVVRSYITSLHAVKSSQDFLIAGLLLEQKLWQKQEEQTRSGGVNTEEEQGEFDPPLDRFSYKIGFEEEENTPFLFKGTFEVFWQERQKGHGISCLTYLRSKKEE